MNATHLIGWARAGGRGLLDLVLPPRCLACGLSFPHDVGPGALCGACSRARPPYDRARAVLVYDDGSRDLILAFKHRDRTEAAPAFAAWMGRAGAALLAEADLLAPVPLHWTRLLARRFNQAGLLANALGRLSGLPVVVDALIRRRRTPSQGRLGRQGRQENVQGAFRVNPRRAAALKGRRVLLIDDVMTTGATLESCARTLRRGGAGAVDALTLARVASDSP